MSDGPDKSPPPSKVPGTGATDRYSRQVLFAPIGRDGQEKLRQAKVVIIGCGALGTSQANLLARAGIGALRIVDRDYVEESNLQRQTLFEESDAARKLPKAIAAEERLRRINSDVRVEAIVADVRNNNIEEFTSGCDLALDGTDNFETRYLLNDVAVKHNLPWIYGAVVGSYGVTLTIVPGRTACLACVFPELPGGILDTCDTLGVIGAAAGWVTAIQVSEALKILVGRSEELHGALLSYDLWMNRRQRIEPRRQPDCRACVARDFTYLEREPPSHISMCGRNSVQIHPRLPRPVNLDLLKTRLVNFGPVQGNEHLVQCRLGDYDLTVFPDGRAIIKGTQDAALARSLYARYIGS
ncbi:MAG: ThiF family adenylyltransferase [Terriglobia bacterium]